MRRQIRRVAGLGDGPELKKSTELAIRHPNVEFVANDIKPLDKRAFRQHLKRMGVTAKPANLTIAASTDAIKLLKNEKPDSFDHIYAHFLLQHMAPEQRAGLFAQVWRTLRPGAKFKTLESGHYSQLLIMELRNRGFKVTARTATLDEVKRVGTPRAIINSVGVRKTNEAMASLKAKIGESAFYELLPETSKRTIADLGDKLAARESPQNRKLVERDLKKMVFSDRPFVIITATKAIIRQM